jgi:hypothetical protein
MLEYSIALAEHFSLQKPKVYTGAKRYTYICIVVRSPTSSELLSTKINIFLCIPNQFICVKNSFVVMQSCTTNCCLSSCLFSLKSDKMASCKYIILIQSTFLKRVIFKTQNAEVMSALGKFIESVYLI